MNSLCLNLNKFIRNQLRKYFSFSYRDETDKACVLLNSSSYIKWIAQIRGPIQCCKIWLASPRKATWNPMGKKTSESDIITYDKKNVCNYKLHKYKTQTSFLHGHTHDLTWYEDDDQISFLSASQQFFNGQSCLIGSIVGKVALTTFVHLDFGVRQQQQISAQEQQSELTLIESNHYSLKSNCCFPGGILIIILQFTKSLLFLQAWWVVAVLQLKSLHLQPENPIFILKTVKMTSTYPSTPQKNQVRKIQKSKAIQWNKYLAHKTKLLSCVQCVKVQNYKPESLS